MYGSESIIRLVSSWLLCKTRLILAKNLDLHLPSIFFCAADCLQHRSSLPLLYLAEENGDAGAAVISIWDQRENRYHGVLWMELSHNRGCSLRSALCLALVSFIIYISGFC